MKVIALPIGTVSQLEATTQKLAQLKFDYNKAMEDWKAADLAFVQSLQGLNASYGLVNGQLSDDCRFLAGDPK